MEIWEGRNTSKVYGGQNSQPKQCSPKGSPINIRTQRNLCRFRDLEKQPLPKSTFGLVCPLSPGCKWRFRTYPVIQWCLACLFFGGGVLFNFQQECPFVSTARNERGSGNRPQREAYHSTKAAKLSILSQCDVIIWTSTLGVCPLVLKYKRVCVLQSRNARYMHVFVELEMKTNVKHCTHYKHMSWRNKYVFKLLEHYTQKENNKLNINIHIYIYYIHNYMNIYIYIYTHSGALAQPLVSECAQLHLSGRRQESGAEASLVSCLKEMEGI